MKLEERASDLIELLEEMAVNTKTVVGDPLRFGDVTLIPVVDVALGCGGSAGEGAASGAAAGSGAGAWLRARALVVMQDGEASLLPITPEGTAEKLVKAVPDLLERLEAIKDQAAG